MTPDAAKVENHTIALPCNVTAQQQIEPNRTKMSAPADSYVRHQFNLKYKKQTLNASFFESGSDQKVLRLDPDRAGLEHAKIDGCYEQSGSYKSRILSLSHENATTPSIRDGIQQSPPGSHALTSLTDGHRLNIAAMASIMDNPLLVEDIRKHKAGTACATLDPKHIWERFRRYNLKRDKQILPLAALRAFIKGWIPDQQVSHLVQAAATERRHGDPSARRANTSAPCPVASPAEVKKKQLKYYIELLNSDQFVPPSMISTQLANELFATGKVAADVLRARGL